MMNWLNTYAYEMVVGALENILEVAYVNMKKILMNNN